MSHFFFFTIFTVFVIRKLSRSFTVILLINISHALFEIFTNHFFYLRQFFLNLLTFSKSVKIYCMVVVVFLYIKLKIYSVLQFLLHKFMLLLKFYVRFDLHQFCKDLSFHFNLKVENLESLIPVHYIGLKSSFFLIF